MIVLKFFYLYYLIIYQVEYVYSGNIIKKISNFFIIKYILFPFLKALNYMGCFPAGYGYNVLDNGLSLFMVNSLSSPPAYFTSNGYYLVLYANMTLELCISICQTNGFMYAGLQTHMGVE